MTKTKQMDRINSFLRNLNRVSEGLGYKWFFQIFRKFVIKYTSHCLVTTVNVCETACNMPHVEPWLENPPPPFKLTKMKILDKVEKGWRLKKKLFKNY